MAVAHNLAKRGCKVTLVESAKQTGGLADAWTIGDVVYDRHYHVVLLSDSKLRGLLRELELEAEMQWVQTRTGFYTDGTLYSLSNTTEFLRFPPLSLLDKLRLGATIFYASRLTDWKPLERISASEWLSKLSGRNTFEKLWRPLLRAKLGNGYSKASAVFIWSIIRRMYSARRAGMKREMFGYVPGGYARILRAFRAKLEQEGVTIQSGCPVTKVASSGDGRVQVEFANAPTEVFDKTVLTMAAPIAASLCPELPEKEREALAGIEYQGIVCASLLSKKPLAGFYVTNITDSSVPFTGVIEMSALVDRTHFNGYSLIYLPKYVPPDDQSFELSESEIQAQFIPALARMYPGFTADDVVAFRVSKARYVFAVPTLGYSERLPPVKTSVPGVHILNSAHILDGTLNVDETLRLAERGMALLV